jgi:predicted nucleic acid-binding protein
MRLVVDANVILSALISDSMTRRLIVTGNDELAAPAYIHEEVKRYVPLVVEKTDRNQATVEELAERLFTFITIVPHEEVVNRLHEAARAMQEIDPDDTLYIATALVSDTTVWSDDNGLQEQNIVPVVTTTDMVERFEDQSPNHDDLI